MRVTDFRIDRVEIAVADFYKLPKETQELIRVYGTPARASSGGKIAFDMAIYRWEEIQKSMRMLEGADHD